MPRSGGRRKKKRTEKEVDVSEREKKLTPRCLVFKRGTVGSRVRNLVNDFREVMMPNCARKLRESRMNRLEDFVAVSGVLKISHFVIFTTSKRHTWMKLVKLPQGPTLTFAVESFSLARDVRGAQRRTQSSKRDLACAPLQVLGGFTGGDEAGMQKLTHEMLRGLFPPIDVPTFNQLECRRAALFNYDREKDFVYFRHFSVGRKPVGLQRGVSKLLRPSRLPKLDRCADVADFVLGGGVGASESEVEDLQEVPSVGRDDGRTAVRLVERGPRLTLLLVKAEEGVCNGAVLYHRYKTRTPTQQEVYEEKARQRRKLKARNEYLESRSAGQKAAHRERTKRKRAAQEPAGGDGEEAADEDGFVRGPAGEDSRPKKKKRFHPFAWGSKKAKGDKQAAGPPGGQKAQGKEARRQQGQQRVLDRFHNSRKTASH